MQNAAKATEPTPVVGSWALVPDAARVAAPVDAIAPDASQALTFFATLFPAAAGQSVHFRGVSEPKDNRPQQNLHYALDEDFESNLRGFLDWCNVDGRAAFFLPGTVQGAGTGKKDVLSLTAVLVDFDKDDPSYNLTRTEQLIGPATLVVESGGQTTEGHAKLHAYWKVREEDCERVEDICRARECLAIRFGGDRAFKQPAQVIRVPGSVHFKGEPKSVTLRTVRPEAVYNLAELLAKVPDARPAPAANPFDFSGDAPARNDVERVLTAPVHEGGVDDITRFEAAGKAIGHFIRMVREGRMTPDEAWRAACEWNAATLVPPWPEDRLRGDFERLVRNDVESRGPFIPVQPVTQETVPEGFSIAAWNISKLQGKVPERTWLVDGLIPAGTAGVFAAVGDAGKSMLALRLAYVVGCYPASQADPIYDFGAPTFFGQPIVGRGATCVVTSEDDAAEVYRRVAALDASNLRSRHSKTFVVPMLATGGPRAILTDGASGPQATDFWRELRAQLLAIPDLKLVVLDPLSAFISGDTNDNSFGAALMTMLGSFAAESGAAVMVVHHMAKGTVPTDLTDARTSIRGAGALVDNSRWALAMWEADQDKAYSILKPLGQDARASQAGIVYHGGLAKSNAPGTKMLRTLVRNAASGLLEDVTDQLAAVRPQQAEIDAAAFAALLAEAQEDARFAFTAGEQGLWKSWHPVFTQAGVRVVRTEIEGLFHRLLSARKLVRTQQKRGSYPLYAVNVDQ